MQKRANRILSALIALVMVLSMLPATVFATGETDVLEGWSITLGDNIGVKFYLNSADYTVAATVNGAEVTPAISDNVVIVNVAAAQMNDTIVLTVKNGDEIVHTDEYSVREYAETILTGEYADYVKDMVKEMLNYGAAAQTYFNYNSGNLANAGYELETAATVPTEVPEITAVDTLDGISLYGMSLVFRNKTAVRFYFNVSGNIADYTFSQGTPVEKDGKYYVEIGDINPQDLANDITLSVNDGALSVTYSPLNYIVRKYNNAESATELKNLVQAMYGYHLEAKYYNSIIPVTGLANHNAGWDIDRENNNDGLYIQHNAHTATYNSDWSVEYKPVSADAIKLVRGGETFCVADPNNNTLVVYSATEMFLKLEAWTITGDKLPLVDGDQLIIEGEFKHDASGDILAIEETVVQVVNGSLGINAISVGALGNHGGGAGGDGVHVTMTESDAIYNGDWSLEYAPLTANAYRVIRDGVETNIGQPGRGTLVKFSATEGYIKHSGWCVDEFAAQTSDIFIIEGLWKHTAGTTVIQIDKTYMYHNGTTWVLNTKLPTAYNAGVLQTHEAGMSGNGIYVRTAANEAPSNSDWSLEYKQTSADNIKIVRNGETVSIGIAGRPLLIKLNECDYYLKLEGWTVGEYGLNGQPKAITTDDMLIIEGDFFYEAENVTLNITKSYVYYDGTAWVCAAAEPVPETIYEVGVLSAHTAGGSGTGFHANGLENDAPYSDWAAEYAPANKECIQIIRGGETIYRENTGAGAIIKLGGTGYYVKFDTWIDSTNYPLQAGDIIIIEGIFVGTGNYAEAEGVKIKIDKTYVVYDGSNFAFSATEPGTSTVIAGGNLAEHADGWDAAGEIFVSLAENGLPVDENAEVEYTAQSGVIKLVRGGNTLDLTGTIVKYGAADYYMVLGGDALPLQNNDYLIVEGDFTNESNGYTLNIAKTYILVDGENLVYSLTEPEIVNRYAVTGLTNHNAGWDIDRENSNDGLYILTDAHDATYNSDWSVEYAPVSADAIKLIRGGETFNVAGVGSGTLVVYSATEMYLKLESWTITGDKLPLVDGDKLIIDGNFKHNASGDVLDIEKTIIDVVNGRLGINAIAVGSLNNHSNGAGSDGVYATMAENSAAYNADWSLEYAPLTADAYRVIRDGVETNIGQVGRGTLVKFSATEGYLKTSGWCLDTFAAQTTDVLIIEGLWKDKAGSTVISIDKTYLYHNGTTWVFATNLPTIYNAGVLQTHEAGMDGNGIYFRTAAVEAPFNGDWSLEYKQTSVDNIKLIRDGVTTSIGIVDRPLLIKINECDYYLKMEEWTIGAYGLNSTNPITTDDVLIIEGDFHYAAENVTLNITKSYIYYDGSAWVCSAEEPVSIPNAGVLSAHSGGGSATGFHAIGAENDAPYDWAAEYAPSSKECIQIIRNGQTIYRNNTGAGAIIKFSASEYYVKFDTWIDSENYPLQAGDIIIIEGIFVGTGNYAAAEGVQLKIEKTFVVYNGSSFTFSTKDPRVINVDAMYAQGGTNWNGNVGINFAVDADDVPYNADWSVEYVPVSNEAIKLIRNGETKNIANTGAGTIVKLGEDNCYLKLEQWMIGDVYPIREGDVLIVEGEFKQKNGDYTMVIDKTYIVIGNVANDEVTFTTHYENTDFGAVALPTSTDTLKIGMWNGSHHVFDHKQLQELKAAGITKIMGVNTQWIGTEDVNAWLDRVYSYGISVIFDLRDWDGTTVPSYASHPGVMGFLMYDEPGADVFDDLATLKAQFDAVMPADKLFYVNLFPECAANSSLGTESSWWDSIFGDEKDYDTDYVTAFLNALDIQVLSWDNYSLITNSSNAEGIRIEYFHNFEVMASKNLPLWYTMLSAGHTAGASDTYYATPTAEELRWQMAVAMTYGVQNIDHYVYASHEDGYSCMVEYEDADRDGIYWETTDLYDDILTVDNEYLAWDNIFMAYDWQGVGVYDAGATNTMLSVLENKLNLANYGLTVSSSNEDLLIGVFDHNGSKAYMVTNAGSAGSSTVGDGKNFTTNDAAVTLNLGAGNYKCAAVIDNGNVTYVAVNNGTVTLNVEAYEGVFVIPVLN